MSLVHLGLDVGGTASRWVACSADGTVLARGSAQGATAHVFNPAERERLRSMLDEVASGLATLGHAAVTLTAGMTGYGAPAAADLRALAGAVLGVPGDGIVLMDDIVLAYLTLFEPGGGHLVSAGTGSIGIHIAADGTMVRVGGRGILIDDAGSGSWIALRAMDRLYRLLDHTGGYGQATRLAEALFARVGGRDWHDVRQFVYAGDRGRIGTLAIAVAEAAEAGDAVALDILQAAGAELALLAQALTVRAGPGPIRFIGGVLHLHKAILTAIDRALPGGDVRHTLQDAALAAAQLQTAGRPAWARLRDSTSLFG